MHKFQKLQKFEIFLKLNKKTFTINKKLFNEINKNKETILNNEVKKEDLLKNENNEDLLKTLKTENIKETELNKENIEKLSIIIENQKIQNETEVKENLSELKELQENEKKILDQENLNKALHLRIFEAIKSKFKHLWEEYGIFGIILYFAIYFICLFGIYFYLVWMRKPGDENKEKSKNWTLFISAWGITKVIEPLRLISTLFLLKPLKKFFKKFF
jgi:hypothetical protein